LHLKRIQLKSKNQTRHLYRGHATSHLVVVVVVVVVKRKAAPLSAPLGRCQSNRTQGFMLAHFVALLSLSTCL